MESPKMYSSCWCKYLPYLCGTANDPVSSKPVQGREQKFAESRVYFQPQYRVSTKAMFISKGRLYVWRVQKCISQVGARPSLTCAGLEMTPFHISHCRVENGNLRNPGSTFSHGTVFAPKQCLYQKKATGMESPKMYFSSRCKTLTYLCGTVNNPVSSKPVQSRKRKFSEFRVYLQPWYRVCTKAMFISKGSYGYGESKNVFHSSVQKPHLPVQDCKRPSLK